MSSDTLGRELLRLARSAIAARFGQVIAASTASDPALTAPSEQKAINDALASCVKSDSDCHVIAIGPFAVGPN